MRRPDPNDPRFKRLTGNQCFWTGCGEYFTTVGNFDRHQLINKPCRHPRDVGLIQDAQGYWQMPEKTAEEFTADGYFKTGDVGRFDENGYLSIVGRSKDLIISGGYNVYPKEIESVIDEMPGVLESAVIGITHPDFGEAVTAVVVPRDGALLSEAAIIESLKQKIANFKVPKRVHVVDELPRNTMGKVQKNLLRERFG